MYQKLHSLAINSLWLLNSCKLNAMNYKTVKSIKSHCIYTRNANKTCFKIVRSHRPAMPQRMYSILKTCQRGVGWPRNMPKISNLPAIKTICASIAIYFDFSK